MIENKFYVENDIFLFQFKKSNFVIGLKCDDLLIFR